MKKEEAPRDVEIQATLSDVPSSTPPQGLCLHPLDRCQREGTVGSHPASSNPFSPGHPDLFRLPRRGCRCPLHSVKGTLGRVVGERETTTKPGPSTYTHTHTQLRASASPQASPAPSGSPTPSSSASARVVHPRSSPPLAARPLRGPPWALPLRRPRTVPSSPFPSRAPFQRVPPPQSLFLPQPPPAIAGVSSPA